LNVFHEWNLLVEPVVNILEPKKIRISLFPKTPPPVPGTKSGPLLRAKGVLPLEIIGRFILSNGKRFNPKVISLWSYLAGNWIPIGFSSGSDKIKSES
jgi:hypothetical protein